MSNSAHDVAACLINEQVKAKRGIDKMQLQKLLYLVQGANVEYWGEPAFREPLLAYRNGPVVRAVEASYREAAVGRESLTRAFGGHPDHLMDEVIETIGSVLRYFGTWTGPNLERYVKGQGSPWQQARGALPLDAPSDVEIPLSLIAHWFREHGVNPSPRTVRPWSATEHDRLAADERLHLAKAQGAFGPVLSPDVCDIAERALARLTLTDRPEQRS